MREHGAFMSKQGKHMREQYENKRTVWLYEITWQGEYMREHGEYMGKRDEYMRDQGEYMWK